LPGNLPFELETYRVMIIFLFAGWVTSLLIDPRVKGRTPALHGPLLALSCGILLSVVANATNIVAAGLEQDVVKKLTFFASFILIVYVITSVATRFVELDLLVRVLVVGGGVLAVLAIVEGRTSYNVFNHLSGVVPFQEPGVFPDTEGDVTGFSRGGRPRAYASAEHPIALGAALAILLPLGLYLVATTTRRIWWIPAGLLMLGTFATVSRTVVLMILAVGVVYAILRPRHVRRFWPALLLAPVLIHFALPATLGPLKESFFPAGGLLEEQRRSAGTQGSGRVADLDPTLNDVKARPLFGQGFGSVVAEPQPGVRAPKILDNQWLGSLLEIGLLGAGALLWLFCRTVRRLGRAGRRDDSPRGELAVALASAVTAYAVGMITFDAFAFVQVTFLLFILFGIACSLLRLTFAAPERPATP
jgi:hypothetical protein